MWPFDRRRRSSVVVVIVLLCFASHLISSSLSLLFLVANEQSSALTTFNRRSVMLSSVGGLVFASSGSSAVGSKIPDFQLASGMTIPMMALNTAGLSAEDAESATRLALSIGIRHVDFHPGQERDGVARVVASQGREVFFLTTKIAKFKDEPPDPVVAAARARKQIEDDFGVLNTNVVDMLLLRDSPSCKVMQAQWAVLEGALAAGKTRAIGVVNYCEKALSCLLQSAKIKPAVNYFMLHAGMGPDAHGLRSFGESRGIKTFAYGALGEPGPSAEFLDSPILQHIAAVRGRSVAQVALRWVVQSGVAVSVRPTAKFGLGGSLCDGSSCLTGLNERLQTFDWSLTPEEMIQINAMTSPDGNPTLFSSSGCKNCYGCT